MKRQKMENNFSELIEYLDGKFTKIDERFTRIDERFTKIDERFTKIEKDSSEFRQGVTAQFLDVGQQLEKIENTLEQKADKSNVDNLCCAVDAYAKKADTYFQEMVSLSHKVDRQEKWIHQMADKLG